ncbi:hypothetical protein HHI36_018793 [Cryptolaemus montrouzieri]|uniref:Uncharacterized protein n=1 Tax=Cryptolaemus montrouzieri TaxID=559131 RepID=A0ABD2P161_9CUCU
MELQLSQQTEEIVRLISELESLTEKIEEHKMKKANMLTSIEVLSVENLFYREQADNLQLIERKQQEENTCAKPKNKRPSRNTLFHEIGEQKQNEENDSQHDRASPDFIQELYKKIIP